MDKDSDRPSMHPDADDIEIRYIIVERNAPPPETADDCPSSENSKSAVFRFIAGADKPGMRLHAFLRWRNSSEKSKSGPWSQKETIIIGD